jgi:uncharacterized protein (DUF2235 family)
MKRLIVCCDGTWNGLSGEYPTNVVKISQAIRSMDEQGIPQLVYYEEGLGTKWYDRWVGGAFGWGIDANIADAYRFLCLNYESGDEIYLFGFSRGAYTVRSLVGFISCSGLLSRPHIRKLPAAYKLYRNRNIESEHPQAVEFRQKYGDRIPIKMLGCWDTVGSLGIPDLIPLLPFDRLINLKYQFHNTRLSSIIQNAFHAMAIDERRKSFVVTHMQKSNKNLSQQVEEVWFPGTHGCVGGGTLENRKLSDATLSWMMEKVGVLGLAFDQNLIEDGIELNPLANFSKKLGIFWLAGVTDRPIVGGIETLHVSARQRWCDRKDYRPKKLLPFSKNLDANCNSNSM